MVRLIDDRAGRGELLVALWGQLEEILAAVVRVALAGDESAGLQRRSPCA